FAEIDFERTDDAGGLTGFVVVAGQAEHVGLAGFETGGDVVEFYGARAVAGAEIEFIDPAAAFVIAGVLEGCADDGAARGNGDDATEIIRGGRGGILRLAAGRPDPTRVLKGFGVVLAVEADPLGVAPIGF